MEKKLSKILLKINTSLIKIKSVIEFFKAVLTILRRKPSTFLRLTKNNEKKKNVKNEKHFPNVREKA